MLSTDLRDEDLRAASGRRAFGGFLAVYGLAWAAILMGFAALSYPILEKFAEAQLEERLRANAALIEEYVSALGAYSRGYKPVLEQLCRRLSQPEILDARVTLFNTQARIIADSRSGTPLEDPSPDLPEIRAALRKEIGTSIRYSRASRRRMAFVAYPHAHLGKVECVIRVGVPFVPLGRALRGAYFAIAAAGFGLATIAAALSSLAALYRERESGPSPRGQRPR